MKKKEKLKVGSTTNFCCVEKHLRLYCIYFDYSTLVVTSIMCLQSSKSFLLLTIESLVVRFFSAR